MIFYVVLQGHPNYLKKGKKEDMGNCKPANLTLNSCKGDGVINPGYYFQPCEGQESDWEQSAQIYKGEIVLDEPDPLL